MCYTRVIPTTDTNTDNHFEAAIKALIATRSTRFPLYLPSDGRQDAAAIGASLCLSPNEQTQDFQVL